MGKERKERGAAAARASHMELLKSRGQHFLKNPLIVDAIVEKAGIKPTDTVLEIGPGSGNLTAKLVTVARKVIAIEIDPRMVGELYKRFQGTEAMHRLEVIHADVMKRDLPYFDLCVANLPYQISAPFVNKLLIHRPFFRGAVLMFQKEFAQRLVAQKGDDQYCRLSVNTQLLSTVQHLLKVGKNNFRPPKVDSAVVRIVQRNPPPPINFLEWDGLVRLCFNRKNKTLGAIFGTKDVISMMHANFLTAKALQNGSGLVDPMAAAADVQMGEEDAQASEAKTKEAIHAILERIGLHDQRSAKLDEDDFLRVLKEMNEAGFHFS